MGEEMKADRDGRAAALGFGDDDRGDGVDGKTLISGPRLGPLEQWWSL
jgi:hypothetical protein